MKTQLALQNLAQNKARTCVATAGVTFAVVLIFMQLGFLGATRRTATLIYDGLDFDIVLRSPSYVHLTDARTLPRERLLQ
ncbi:MAG: DevC protein, partial [Pirellulales bacterium]